VVLNTLPKRDSGKPSNVTVRGTSDTGLALRPQVRIVQGRMFRPGTSEIVTGRAVARGFAGAGLGETMRFAGRDWLVVGVFDASRSAFDSEVWGDSEQMMQAFRRGAFSSVVFRLADADSFDAVKAQLESDPRLTLEAKREVAFYAEQSEALATFIRLLGLALSIIFSIGAVVGAMITMFATVAARVSEIGTLRALGFRRSAVLAAFLRSRWALRSPWAWSAASFRLGALRSSRSSMACAPPDLRPYLASTSGLSPCTSAPSNTTAASRSAPCGAKSSSPCPTS
jgi:ABC-type antimicrobial peptide transport system permease subunit